MTLCYLSRDSPLHMVIVGFFFPLKEGCGLPIGEFKSKKLCEYSGLDIGSEKSVWGGRGKENP